MANTKVPTTMITGLGTAATANTGTSGATVPLLNGTNTFSNTQTLAGGARLNNAQFIAGERNAGGTWDNMLALSTGDDTLLRAGSGGDIIFQSNAAVTMGTLTSAGLLSVDAGVVNGIGSKTLSVAMSDDTATDLTPLIINGLVSFAVRNQSTNITSGLVRYGTAAGGAYTTAVSIGASAAVATGTLAGTTGADTFITVSAHTDGKLYFENRRGGNITLDISIF